MMDIRERYMEYKQVLETENKNPYWGRTGKLFLGVLGLYLLIMILFGKATIWEAIIGIFMVFLIIGCALFFSKTFAIYTCPKCRGALIDLNKKSIKCLRCGFKEDLEIIVPTRWGGLRTTKK